MAEKFTGLALRFISGKYQGNEFPLKANQEIIAGRGSEFDIVLVEDMVSRRHAKFITGDDYVVLQDLGSTNGSFVNGERVRKLRLREGDRILIGTSILKLVPFKGEEIGGGPASNLLALPPATPSKETKQLPAFDPAKALPAPGSGPPSLDFLPKPTGSPSSSSSSSAFAAAPAAASSDSLRYFDGPAAAPTHTPSHDIDEERLANQPPPSFGQASMTGNFNETPLVDLLDLFANSRKNGVLIIDNNKEGRLHFRNGRIVYAILDNNFTVPPHKSAYRILQWNTGGFHLYPPKDDEIHEAIDEDALSLYQKAQRQKEELKRYQSELPSQTHNVSVSMPLRAPLRDLRPDYLDTVQLVYNYGILDQILNKSTYTDIETYQHLAYLFKHNYIKAH